MANIKEILMYEVYKKKDCFYLHVPVQNLINPKFLFKDNALYILLYDYTQGYILNNIPREVFQSIQEEKCYLSEAMNSNLINHKIVLIP